ncbi:MAG: endonuclease MutS2 [Oscillospiraceae bacterium]|jgi:DNA mismatch repair protein MutS2|nr:endonuclease MutS2 [Oscillospiraceae bacterium]
MTLFEKSLNILELPEILNLLAAEAVSKSANELVGKLFPYTDIDIVQKKLDETSAAKNMMVLRQSPPFLGVKDVRGSVKRANKSGVLNTRELLDISELLRAASSSITYFNNDKANEPTVIDYLFNSLISNKYLENKISTSIVSEEEISDNASRELSDIRRFMRITNDKIRQTLNKIITSPTYAKALQEPIITIRNDRFVVPIKAEYKSTFSGMVHDISSSGATHFIEPMSVVNLNNELRELTSQEKHEIERILMELSSEVSDHANTIINDFEILTELDFIFAKAKLSYKMDATAPVLSEYREINFIKAYHPLLPKKDAVPIDIRLGADFDTLVITGPNTGGKTVSLKTLGLLCAMTQCGLHIPVGHGSITPVLDTIYADIGDEQSIEQSLSTFSSHMTNIVGILDNCTPNSLLLFDELGAGTDPVEGAALAISIIEYARKESALIAATTHYAELKSFALSTDGVMNASCEFNVETLKPTYKLIIGIPGKSNAFAISSRLGLSDKIINDAKARINTDSVAFEDAIAGLEETRILLENERDETSKLLRDADADRQYAKEVKSQLDKERDKEVSKAKKEAIGILEETRRIADQIMNEMQELRKSAADTDWQKLNEKKSEVLGKLNKAEEKLTERKTVVKSKASKRDIIPGDKVQLNDLGTFADVIEVKNDGSLILQAGILKITAQPSEVLLMEDETTKEAKKYINRSENKLRLSTVKPELEIRGMNIDEAMPILEQYLDNAKMSKLPSVTIIHGKGTGVLRKAVHKYLKDEKGVKSFRLGLYGEGEDGVTIVEL